MNIISIDLGATNTQIAYLNEQGEPCILQIGGQDSIPSLLFYDESQDKLLVGKQARNAYTRLRLRDARLAEQRLLCGEQFKPRLCERAVKADSCCFAPVRGREISWLEVVKAFFSFCKREAERCAFDGETVQGVRLTHPAEFSSLLLYEIAAKAVGFNSVEFVPEPAAAFLACESIHELNTVVLVFDMGGGTLDIVCAEKQKSGQVHLSGEKRLTLRNVNVGGEYIDRALCNELLPQLRELPGAESYRPDDDFRRWVQESVKEYLGEGWYEDCEATYYIEQPGTLARFSTVYTYDKLVELVNREYQPVFHDLERYIEQRHESERPSMVLMVGGSSRMKPIQEQLRKMFPGRDKVLVPHDGGSLVVKGALLKPDAAENEHAGNDNERRRVLARCKTLRIENKQLRNEIADLNKRIEILLSRVSAYGISIGGLTNEKEQLFREIKRLEDECSTLRSEIEQLKKAKEEECDSLKITNVSLEGKLKAAIDEKNAEEKEKLKWQSRCANYQRSEDALRKEKATLQIETISLQKKLDDECRIGWLWKACLALLLGVALGCAYATLFSKPQKADQQGAFSATHDISISKAYCKEESKSEQTQKNEVSDAAAESNVTRQRSALELLRESAEQGDKKAQYELGLCYAKAKDVAQNWGEAFKWFEKAARSNHVQAQSWLGWCYANGKGVNQDWLSSAKWYENAATQGDAFSQNQLGFYYENGQGVERDYTKAVGWYGRAAEQGRIDAQYRLGVCYELGNGVQKNFEIADKWYKKAAAGGQEQAKKIMSQQANDGRQNIQNDNLSGETTYITVAAAEPKETSAQRAKQRLKELGVKSDDYNNEIFKIFKEEKNENQEILTKLELLIQAGASVNCVDTVPGGNGMTPLGCAAYKGWSRCLKFLLKQPQIKVNLKDKTLECTPLFWAVRSGNVECVSALLSVPDIKVNEVNGKEKWTALLYAVYNNDLKSLEFLLRRNDVDVNAKEAALGRTPLHCAAKRGHKDCIRMLKEHPNIKLNEKDKNNKTPRELATDEECKNLLSE